MPQPHTELNGHIYYKTGNPSIYWIDQGLARHIADEATYHGVFGSSPNKQEDDLLADIQTGPDVAPQTVLVRAGNDAEIYLVDQGQKRYIPSESIKAKYQLNGSVHSVPPAVLETMPEGLAFN